jgi:hypothetical protein
MRRQGVCNLSSTRRSPSNLLQRSGQDKVQAPKCCVGVGFGGSAPQERRAAAELGR